MDDFQTDVLTRLARIEQSLECVPALSERMQSIERDRSKLLGWIAGVGLTASGAGALLARLGLLTFLLLAGCASVPIPSDGVHRIEPIASGHSWQHRPVDVLIDSELPDKCLDSILSGLLFWHAAGVDYLRPKVVDSAAGEFGQIVVRADDMREDAIEKGYLAVTWMVLNDQDLWVRHADIFLVPFGCNPLVAAHELGHAVGLVEHSDDPLNLMHPSPQAFGLTAEQLEQLE